VWGEMKFVCPQPTAWVEVHGALTRAWEARKREGPPPPKPLILTGWISTNDLEKAQRWRETVTWARAHNLGRLVEAREQDGYCVEEFTTYEVRPLGGPMYLPWNFDAKPTPPPGSVQTAMTILLRDWPTIVGWELGRMTTPLRFTGKKKRRLVVKADAEQVPPWGGWNHLAPGEERRTFTRMRSAVNQAIASVKVDHIDFEPSDWTGLPE
jgi:hypothetical protein